MTGTPNFPAFAGVQNTYYQYVSTQLKHYGSDIRAYYDQLSSQAWQLARIADTKLSRLKVAFFATLFFLSAWALARIFLSLAG